MPSSAPAPPLRFGPFELDRDSGELRKHGLRIKLHEKPLQVLLALLEQPGQVITRKALQDLLWPGQTFVEFENGLNNAISRLREALGDSAETPRFIETVPRHGYRFLVEVSRDAPSSHLAAPLRSWLLVIALTLGVALLLGAVFHFALPPSKAIQSLAVLPFRNLGTGTADDYFADGMTDAVTTQLAKLGVSKVISETSVAQFRDTKETVPDIARALGVDAIVEGAVLREGDRVRITVQLIRADTDRHIWAESYERNMTDILDLQSTVALGVARAIQSKLSPAKASQPAAPRPVNAEAYNAYLEGRYFLREGSEGLGLGRGKEYLERAIQLDPGFAPSYVALSAYYVLADAESPDVAFPKAKELAQKALQLDPNLPEAHACIGFAYFYGDWNWSSAETELKRAIALDPNFSLGHRWYAVYLAAMGRDSEALAEAERAEDLDPLSIVSHDGLAIVALWTGRYDRSIQEGQKILELAPNDARGYEHLAVGHLQKRMYEQALLEAEKGLELSRRDPLFVFLSAFAYGRLGKMQQAEKLVEEMRGAGGKRFVSPYFVASALAGMNRNSQAMDALVEGYRVHDSYLVFVRVTPWFDSLHSDPRFQDLLRRMNFPR